jgi:hypothetical protein
MMKTRFDHSYTPDKNFKFRTKLGKAGFYLGDRMVEHPGKAFCKFIFFPATKKSGKQYIEFIHVGKGGAGHARAGMSLGSLNPLEAFAQKLNTKNLKALFQHKNYEWKKNSKDSLPGWNFVFFPKHKSKIFTWLTEYEYSEKRKSLKGKDATHPNQVYKILALELDLNTVDLNLYTHLCGKPKKNEFLLNCGTPLKFTKAKNTRFRRIILATKDLKKLVKKFDWDELTNYEGSPGVLIKNPNPKLWDIVIVQG